MATGDNTRLPQAATTGDLTATNLITGGVADGAKVQRIKVGFGVDGAYADVENSNPLPVAGAVTVSGVATAAAQSTAQTALNAIKIATEAGATATGQTTGNGTLASILSGLAALATSAAQTAAQTALDAIKAAVEGTIDVAGIVDVASLPSLPAGSNAIGSVTVTSAPTTAVTIAALPALAAGTNNIGDVDIASLPSLPAGTATIGATKVDSSNVDTYHAGTITSGAVTSVRSAACRVYHIEWTNATGSTAMIGLYDKATAPVVGTDYPRCEVIATNNNPASRDLGTHGIKFLYGVQAVVYTVARTPTPVASINATFTLALDP